MCSKCIDGLPSPTILYVHVLTAFEVEKANVSILMSRYDDWKRRMTYDLVDLGARRAIYNRIVGD